MRAAEIGDDKSVKESQRGVYLLFTECHKGTESDHSNARGYSLVATETRA
jgi:hypothetical protein